MSSFVGLYTGLSGVRAAQTGIDVASHNVSNSATKGYTRQRVELAASPSYQSPAGRIGTGVTVSQIGRLRDVFLDSRARTALADHGAASVRGDLLSRLEELTGEPDGGVTNRLSALWSAAESWANAPADPASRRQVLTELASLSETFRSVANQWESLRLDASNERDSRIVAANDALKSLADLDLRLANADPSRVGPDLLDQRDLLLDEVAHLTGATTRVDSEGRASVVLGGVSLVSADGAGRLELDPSGAVLAVDPLGTATDVTPQVGGMIGGLTRAFDQDLPHWRSELDAIATAAASAVNGVNTSGVLADGSPGLDLLTFDPADPARTLATTTNDVAALAAATSGAPPAPHDGSNARIFADLRTTELTTGTGAPGDPVRTGTLGTRTADLIVGLAGDVRSAKTATAAARAVSSSATLARDAEHGVSIDEEMVGLVRYQRALEAAARVMTTVDQALDTLVNRVGIVGR